MYRDLHIRRVIWLNLGIIAVIATTACLVTTLAGVHSLIPTFISTITGILLALHVSFLFTRQAELSGPGYKPYRELYALTIQCLQVSQHYTTNILTDCALGVKRGSGPFLIVERYDPQVAAGLLTSGPAPSKVMLESFHLTPFSIIRVYGQAEVLKRDGKVLLGPIQPPALEHFRAAPKEEQDLIADSSTVSARGISRLNGQLHELLQVLRSQASQ